jgi:hypothetical protein
MSFKWAGVVLAASLALQAAGQSAERAAPERAAPQREVPQRRMGVRQKPDTVFTQPVDQVLPELAGATATGENGRVGGELVFWGYKLGDGRPVFLFACAPSDVVNCDERVQLICTRRTEVLRSTAVGGETTQRMCREMAIVAPGDIRPGCTDRALTADLAVGLVSCG